MKLALCVMSLCLLAASVQAREIPIDSIEAYLTFSMERSGELRKSIDPTDPQDLRLAMDIYLKLLETAPDIVHAKYYFALLKSCGMSEAICRGLGQVCSDISRKIDGVDVWLPEFKSQESVNQVSEATSHLRLIVKDIIDSIPTEDCQQYVRDGQWVDD